METPAHKIRTAVFGGTFDPIHIGHAMVANYVAQWCDVDEVWLMVSPCNPLKSSSSRMFPDSRRLEFASLVAERCVNTRVSDFEMSLPLPSYTFRTLCELSRRYPDREFELVIGADNWLHFDRWRNWREILETYRLIVYPRPGYDMPEQAETLYGSCRGVTVLRSAPLALISSSFIRGALRDGKNVNFFLPVPVAESLLKDGTKINEKI